MQDNLSRDLKTLVASEKGQGGTIHDDMSNDGGISELTQEQTLTIFGHTFAMDELSNISRFASRLKMAADSLAGRQQILDGSIFIVKVSHQQAQVSFGGISQK